MPTGRPPTPISLRLLRGNPGKRPFKTGIEPARPPDIPEPPEYLGEFGREEWRRLAPEMDPSDF